MAGAIFQKHQPQVVNLAPARPHTPITWAAEGAAILVRVRVEWDDGLVEHPQAEAVGWDADTVICRMLRWRQGFGEQRRFYAADVTREV